MRHRRPNKARGSRATPLDSAISRPLRARRSSGSKLAIRACCAIRFSVSVLLNSLPSIAATGVSVPSIAALSTSMSSCCQRSAIALARRAMLSPSVEVERRDRRAATGFVDAVFEFLEPARGARGDHDPCAPRAASDSRDSFARCRGSPP